MHDALVVIDGVRTPFAKMGSDFAGLSADELGRTAVQALLARTSIDLGQIDEVIFGCVGQPAEAMNIARVIALRSGIPHHVPAMTVHRNCASGFEAITTAAERIAAGRGSIFIVGGTESMSQMPLYFNQSAARKFAGVARSKSFTQRAMAMAAFRPKDFAPRVGLKLGLSDPVSGLNMGETAELLARELGVTRQSQDEFALRSHHRAVAARDRTADEITPLYVNGKAITRDNGPREGQTLEQLARLKPVFDSRMGTVTAGNSSQVTDGAVALLVMSATRAQDMGLQPLGRLDSYVYTGCDPARMGLGPVSAIRKLGRSPAIADIVEINEAFSAQVLAVLKQLGDVPDDKLNVNGGSIALGHPVGATGARLVLTALKELQRRNAQHALVSLCVGGGQGGAIWLTRGN